MQICVVINCTGKHVVLYFFMCNIMLILNNLFEHIARLSQVLLWYCQGLTYSPERIMFETFLHQDCHTQLPWLLPYRRNFQGSLGLVCLWVDSSDGALHLVSSRAGEDSWLPVPNPLSKLVYGYLYMNRSIKIMKLLQIITKTYWVLCMLINVFEYHSFNSTLHPLI